jgi:hypothetical protein
MPPVFAAGNAQHAAALAEVDFSASAIPAFTTINCRIKRHSVAGFPVGNFVSHPRNLSRRFMPHDDWGNASAGAAVHAMHIAAANAARAHPHQSFIGLQIRNRNVLDCEAAPFFEDKSFHAKSLQVMFTGSTSVGYDMVVSASTKNGWKVAVTSTPTCYMNKSNRLKP